MDAFSKLDKVERLDRSWCHSLPCADIRSLTGHDCLLLMGLIYFRFVPKMLAAHIIVAADLCQICTLAGIDLGGWEPVGADRQDVGTGKF